MSLIFDKLVEHSKYLLAELEKSGSRAYEPHEFSWDNSFFYSDKFRRAHLDVVDARGTKKLYMMHLCIFPHIDDASPIYGFDLIAGPNKVTGAFHDFSPTLPSNFMCDWFADKVRDLEWSKPRDLPEWARNIFSGSMVAAGNIGTEEELDRVLSLSRETLAYYLESVGNSTGKFSGYAQDRYCYNQQQNPHTPRVMKALGYDDDTVSRFIRECLFPMISERL